MKHSATWMALTEPFFGDRRGLAMIQCSECEFFNREGSGRLGFKCDAFSTIKEPECLTKWQILRSAELSQKLDRMIAAYEATLAIYRRLQPLQEKMFRHMEREIDDAEEADTWKFGEASDDSEQEDEGTEGDEEEGPYTR
ncbi:MAG: hypothetical protein ABII12_14615 [Planctomycetota bacterium]